MHRWIIWGQVACVAVATLSSLIDSGRAPRWLSPIMCLLPIVLLSMFLAPLVVLSGAQRRGIADGQKILIFVVSISLSVATAFVLLPGFQ